MGRHAPKEDGMKRVAIGCGIMLAIFLVLIGLAAGVGRYRSSVKRGSWLEATFEGPYLEYQLASDFATIYLGPSGDINLVGLMAQSMFLRGTLDLLGIYPDMEHIGDYKTAMNFWTEKSFTPAHREMYQNLIESIEKTLVAGVAQGRKLREAEVRALFRKAPFLGKEALQAKLVDGVQYR